MPHKSSVTISYRMLRPAAISIPALRTEQAERTSDFLGKVPLLRSVSDSLAIRGEIIKATAGPSFTEDNPGPAAA